ncbi:MAG: hypothetical protein KA354_20065 [Phycisphaerae bacterium]|nr:hypothetical protein [Phycisphaerae bacterium]
MSRTRFGRPARRGGMCLLWAAMLVGTMGLSCDQQAQAVFRQTAVPEIAAGLTSAYGGTFFDAMVNGLSAAILSAGDASTDSDL